MCTQFRLPPPPPRRTSGLTPPTPRTHVSARLSCGPLGCGHLCPILPSTGVTDTLQLLHGAQGPDSVLTLVQQALGPPSRLPNRVRPIIYPFKKITVMGLRRFCWRGLPCVRETQGWILVPQLGRGARSKYAFVVL